MNFLKSIFSGIKHFIKTDKQFLLFVLFATLFVACFTTSADFFDGRFSEFVENFKLFLQFTYLAFLVFVLVYLLSLSRYIFAVVFPLLMLLSSILAYFRFTAKSVFMPMVLDATLTNDIGNSSELITASLVIYVVFCFLVAIGFAVYRWKKIKFRFSKANTLFLLILLIISGGLLSKFNTRSPAIQRIPFNLYFSTKAYLEQHHEASAHRLSLQQGVICGQNTDSLKVIFIIGESCRADHIGLNGYHRNTTPLLQKDSAISMPHVYSPYAHTNRSVPYILTRASEKYPERAYNEKSFIDIFKACGFYTSWLANQEASTGYVYFMKETDTLLAAKVEKTDNVITKWLDTDLLPLYKKVLANANPKQLIIMHTIGSHWWYNFRYSKEFAHFKPDCKTKTLLACTSEEIINSYDNSVLFTDYFIHNVIEEVKEQEVIVIYLSDHGESLGENGVYFHASDNKPDYYPASFIWMSAAYKQKYPEKFNNLLKNKDHPLTTEFLFHSILDAAGINSPYLQKKLSVFSVNSYQ